MQYDEAENVRKVIHPPTANGKQKMLTINYDANYRFGYPVGTSVPVGGSSLTTSQSYDFLTGLLTSSKGVNGETTMYEYNDALDRLTYVQPPSGVGTSTLSYSGPGAPTTVTVISQLDTGQTLTAVTKYDGLLRAIEERRNDPDGEVSTTTTSGTGVVTTEYQGNTVKVTDQAGR